MRIYRVIRKQDFNPLENGYLVCNKIDSLYFDQNLNYTDYKEQTHRIHFFLTKEDAITYGHSFEVVDNNIEPYYNLSSITDELPSYYYGICELELPIEFVENYLNFGLYNEKPVIEASIVVEDLRKYNNADSRNESLKLRDGQLIDIYEYDFKKPFDQNSDSKEILDYLKENITESNYARLEKQYIDFHTVKEKMK